MLVLSYRTWTWTILSSSYDVVTLDRHQNAVIIPVRHWFVMRIFRWLKTVMQEKNSEREKENPPTFVALMFQTGNTFLLKGFPASDSFLMLLTIFTQIHASEAGKVQYSKYCAGGAFGSCRSLRSWEENVTAKIRQQSSFHIELFFCIISKPCLCLYICTFYYSVLY